MTPDTISALYQRGCRAHPELEVGFATFAAAVERTDSARTVKSTHDFHAEDFYLACACAQGHSQAIRRLEERYTELLRQLGRRAQMAGVDLGELIQLMRVRLFVSTSRESLPAIATYSGAGPLGGWLRVAVARMAVELIDKDEKEKAATVSHKASVLDAAALDNEFERSILRSDLRGAFQTALGAAAHTLSAEERAILRQFYVHKIGVDGVARLLGVHRSNASRAVARARGRLMQETKRQLQAAIGISDASLNSAFGLMRSDLGLDLEVLLQSKEGTPP